MTASDDAKIRVMVDGPYLVSGSIPLAKQTIVVDEDGASAAWLEGDAYPEQETYALCRCGSSCKKPHCDGSHMRNGFDGTETAPREAYAELMEVAEGPAYDLLDVRWMCAEARFCARGDKAWHIVYNTDDPDQAAQLRQECADCPSGRYIARDRATGEWLEPELAKSIGLVEDPKKNVAGPLWVRGGIPVIASDGFEYEVRNRQTLCRCGQSKHKPFCDGAHIAAGFRDE